MGFDLMCNFGLYAQIYGNGQLGRDGVKNFVTSVFDFDYAALADEVSPGFWIRSGHDLTSAIVVKGEYGAVLEVNESKK